MYRWRGIMTYICMCNTCMYVIYVLTTILSIHSTHFLLSQWQPLTSQISRYWPKESSKSSVNAHCFIRQMQSRNPNVFLIQISNLRKVTEYVDTINKCVKDDRLSSIKWCVDDRLSSIKWCVDDRLSSIKWFVEMRNKNMQWSPSKYHAKKRFGLFDSLCTPSISMIAIYRTNSVVMVSWKSARVTWMLNSAV